MAKSRKAPPPPEPARSGKRGSKNARGELNENSQTIERRLGAAALCARPNAEIGHSLCATRKSALSTWRINIRFRIDRSARESPLARGYQNSGDPDIGKKSSYAYTKNYRRSIEYGAVRSASTFDLHPRRKVIYASSASQKNKEYLLRLYVAGTTSKSILAVANIKEICESSLKHPYRPRSDRYLPATGIDEGRQFIAPQHLSKNRRYHCESSLATCPIPNGDGRVGLEA